MNRRPLILDYHSPRPRAAAPYDSLNFFALLLGPPLLILGCAYVFRAILAYCASVEPFSGVAFIVSLFTLAGSVVVGGSLRRRRTR
jgi:hypothetical protein